ncbi:helicase associated domain-containing protein [Streptomyces formicae]|uniref:helicase associated domain-containing protein n=1 Tax=Streptomyces formicae TaxID=1616117 RepID=UPI000BF4F810|nr:helicase associated domain-containing protein [Streptomyces formicae]
MPLPSLLGDGAVRQRKRNTEPCPFRATARTNAPNTTPNCPFCPTCWLLRCSRIPHGRVLAVARAPCRGPASRQGDAANVRGADPRTRNTAAQQFHAREGHLRVPRKHVEGLGFDAGANSSLPGVDGPVEVRLGTWLDNVRKRAGKLSTERRADLDQLGIRW